MKKITFRNTMNENKSLPNNNYSDENDYIYASDDYDFCDYLSDNGCRFEEEDGTFYILDEDGERTGEAYQIVSEDKVYYVANISANGIDEYQEAFTDLEAAKRYARIETHDIRRDKRKGDSVEIRDYAENIEDEDCNCFDYDTIPFEERETVDYKLTAVYAIAESAGDHNIQEAILVHLLSDENKDGDCILFGYDIWEFDTDEDITDALNANTPISAFTIREDGVYIA